MNYKKVLFLCTGNSARSQMAEAFLRTLAGERFEAYSAGLEPRGIHPLTVQVMEEKGIALTNQHSKALDVYINKVQFDYLITVCANAEERCPFFAGMGKRLHWPFEDPAASGGTEEEKLALFREIRDEIEAKIQTWLAEEK